MTRKLFGVWSVVALAVLSGCTQNAAPPASTAYPPYQATEPTQIFPIIDESAEAAAYWVFDPNWQQDLAATEIPVLVSRVGCNGGRTGQVNPPFIAVYDGVTSALEELHQLFVTFTVSPPPPEMAACPTNAAVPYLLQLPAPLGTFTDLMDGICAADSTANNTTFCFVSQRWSQELGAADPNLQAGYGIGQLEGIIEGYLRENAYVADLILVQDGGERIRLGTVDALRNIPEGNNLYSGDRVSVVIADNYIIESFQILNKDTESRATTGPLIGWREG